jgi:di/tricarboxylate transporter
MNRMVSKRRQRQFCTYVIIIVVVFFVLYYAAPLIGGLFGSEDDTISKLNVEDMK